MTKLRKVYLYLFQKVSIVVHYAHVIGRHHLLRQWCRFPPLSTGYNWTLEHEPVLQKPKQDIEDANHEILLKQG